MFEWFSTFVVDFGRDGSRPKLDYILAFRYPVQGELCLELCVRVCPGDRLRSNAEVELSARRLRD